MKVNFNVDFTGPAGVSGTAKIEFECSPEETMASYKLQKELAPQLAEALKSGFCHLAEAQVTSARIRAEGDLEEVRVRAESDVEVARLRASTEVEVARMRYPQETSSD